MGNRLISGKQKDQKSKEDRKREKDEKKEKEKLHKKERKEKKKKRHVSGLDTDFDDSSHVTGGDSESCVFHSAENISASPYLDACTRSELEQGLSWSGMYESYSSASHHPKVLSSKDFKDGFSLEACIPPEIAHREICDDGSSSTTSRFEGRSGSSFKSRKSNNSVNSESAQPRSLHDTPTSFRSHHMADDVGSVGTCSQISGGYHTPLMSTPVFSRVDAPMFSALNTISPLTKVRETDLNDCMDINSKPLTFHHPHFYNHQKLKAQRPQPAINASNELKHLPKPTSPYPQRRALSPKMTTSPIKLISSDDSSSSHTTPTPQRRANLLDLFKNVSKKRNNKDKNQGEEIPDPKKDKLGDEAKNKPLWKTWERSKAKKTEALNKTSIFATTRKTDKMKRNSSSKTDSSDSGNIPSNANGDHSDSRVDTKNVTTKINQFNYFSNNNENRTSSSRSPSFNNDMRRASEDNALRDSSSPIVKSAAFCIMKLEELERSIEETIREKFPDAEPFLLKKRSKEDETRGSRSLPSTPSLKKKLYVARDVNNTKISSPKSKPEIHHDNGNTRYCDETYELCPSPAMSPVILRRFGARTRHASISPKIPRAKTATLYSSPSEMEKSVSTKTVTKIPVYQAVTSCHTPQPAMSLLMKPLCPTQKSESKYDNVMDEEYDSHVPPSSGTRTVQPVSTAMFDSDEDDGTTEYDSLTGNNDKTVIVPTFSAVFGSVSPKLKRHLQSKFEESKLKVEPKGTVIPFTKAVDTSRTNTDRGVAANTYKLINTSSSSPIQFKKALNSLKLDKVEEKSIQDRGNVKAPKTNCISLKSSIVKTTSETSTSSISVIPAVETLYISSTASPNAGGPASLSLRAATKGQSNQDVISNSNSGTSKLTLSQNKQDAITAPCQETQIAVSGRSDEGCRPSRVESNQPGDKEKTTTLTSPGAQRKHSSDHVVFGSAIALPCRVYSSTPLSPTSAGLGESVNGSGQEYTYENNESQNVSCAAKLQNWVSEEHSSEHERPHCNTNITKLGEVVRTVKSDYSFLHGIETRVGHESKDKAVVSDISILKKRQLDEELRELKCSQVIKQSSESNNEGNSVSVKKCEVEDCKQLNIKPKDNEVNQTFAVLRNPVSKVISEMINISKQEEQMEKRRQQEHRTLHQSSPGYGVKRVQEAIAVINSPTYGQSCLILEERTVRSDSSVSLPSSPTTTYTRGVDRDFSNSDQDIKESRCQEIQTDSVTTADKGVDSNSLTRKTDSSKAINSGRYNLPIVRQSGQNESNLGSLDNNPSVMAKEYCDESSSDENEFLKKVIASSKSPIQKKQEDVAETVDTFDQPPPPPSPTAMQLLIEEYDDEEEDEEAHDLKEIEMAMRRESEIKEFTDKIYNRLSSLLGSQEDMDDNVFEDDVEEKVNPRGMDELLTRLERKAESPVSSSSSEDDMAMFISSSSKFSATDRGLNKNLTIETSSSLSTTTSSESDPYEEPPLFQPSLARDGRDIEDDFHGSNESPDQNNGDVFVFPEIQRARGHRDSDEIRLRRNSREYHSDDDVATGRGIPDYYDDRPLWTKRQKTPGQLSAAMMAIRRRERRERWMKKRRRNKTDLLTTGSSDTGSENAYSSRETFDQFESHRLEYHDDEDAEFAKNEKMIQRQEMGSGILTSPKYSKPILPFGNSNTSDAKEIETISTNIATERACYRNERSKSLSDKDDHYSKSLASGKIDRGSSCEDEDYSTNPVIEAPRFNSDTNLDIPGIEETFNELMSVKQILEELQDRNPKNDETFDVKCMPLTTENVKTIREYYKDCYSSGNGRRSRMSATDRTESDLDIYSEIRDDDESSDSNFNADDEDDEDFVEPYATADDELTATGGSSSAGCRDSQHNPGDDDDSETNVVVSCTFYNSSVLPATPVDTPAPLKTLSAKSSLKSTPKTLTPTTQTSVLNSDEEFWTGSMALEDSYRQVVTVADAVSSTFQNAREQMHEIQHHLQALRRQMEVMQDDLSSTSLAFAQERTTDSFQK